MSCLLVTGGHGFVGSAIVHELISDHEIIVLQRDGSDASRNADISDRINCFEFNGEKGALEKLFSSRSVDAIIHTAVDYSRDDSALAAALQTNLLLPVMLLEAGSRFGCNTFINTDTFFAKLPDECPYLREYRLSKRQLVNWLEIMSSRASVINMRLEHVYGGGDSAKKFVTSIARQIKMNSDSLDLTGGEQRRDFVHVMDVAKAFRVVLESRPLAENGFRQFEVGTGESFSVREFVEKIKNASGSETQLDFGVLPYRQGELMESVADNSRLQALGWECQVDLSSGILELLDSL